ncbi:hypothetical protein EB796_005557 [Bugula neritina]|uniref:Uncharacterized protein n=1 Tax=Bugula neritina TaxID=10212 RepID=A0A7J7KBY0_BUGNE|nr:hypothetical protein EB796_005557 [Bugula neritina]
MITLDFLCKKKKKKHKSSEKSELKPKIKSPPHSSEHLNTDVPSPPLPPFSRRVPSLIRRELLPNNTT